jgi:hypothetical protein
MREDRRGLDSIPRRRATDPEPRRRADDFQTDASKHASGGGEN